MIEIVTFDPEKELAEAVSRFEAQIGETLFPGDERYLFLAQQVQLAAAQANRVNYAANQNLLRYMSGALLDAYGEQYGILRRGAAYAQTNVAFRTALPLDFPIEIPEGTRVTPDGQLYFLLMRAVQIPAGETEVVGEMRAEKAGSQYNGFLPGQIRNLVDPVGYLDHVENLTISTGGLDPESDESYRLQIQKSWEGYSTCGCAEGYEYWASTASADIAAVTAVSNEASEITVYLLMKDAAIPSQKILEEVFAAINDRKRRPLTDRVSVKPAEIRDYGIELTWYISQSQISRKSAIRDAVKKAVEAFVAAQKQQLGGSINPDALRKRILDAGADRIEMTAPAYTELKNSEVAVANMISVKYGGVSG